MVGATAPRKPMGDSAVASGVVAFLVAGVLFMASVVAVLVTTRNSSDEQATGDAPNAVAYRIQADGLSNVLLDSPGYVDLTQAGCSSLDPDWSKDAMEATGEAAAADCLGRLGLRDSASSVRMFDYAKFQNLRNAPFEESPSAPNDGFVNYVEAREALGLDAGGLDFHIRAYPSLPSVAKLLSCPDVSCKDPNLRVTYIGDIVPPNVPVAPAAVDLAPQLGNPTVTCTVSPNPQAYRIQTTVVNKGAVGSPAAQIRAFFQVSFSKADSHSENVNGPLLNPPTVSGGSGDAVTFAIDVPAYGKRDCSKDTVIRVNLRDINGNLLWVNRTLTSDEAVGADEADKSLWLEADTYFNVGQAMSVTYSGAGDNSFKEADLYLTVADKTGAIVYQTGVQTPNDKVATSRPISIPTALTDAGSPYTATLYDAATADSSKMRVSERLIVLPASTVPSGFTPATGATAAATTYAPTGVVESEVFFLHSLVQKFCPTYYDTKAITPLQPPTSIPEAWVATDADALLDDWDSRCLGFKGATPASYLIGDVYPDNSRILKESLSCRLFVSCDYRNGAARFDLVKVLIVGSNVDHNELAPNEIKDGINRWVRGGGTLIVFGGDDKMNWLQPILHTGTKSSSGGVSVPDAAHPVLHVPDELAYPQYDHRSQVWDFRGSHDADNLFTQIVAQGTAPDYEPILAVSKPGAIRDETTGTSGTVILTTWLPYDLFQGKNNAAKTSEGQKFVNNLLMMGYGDLYLDYGPPIPDDTNVVPSIRTGQIRHPEFDDPLQITMQVFVFPGIGT